MHYCRRRKRGVKTRDVLWKSFNIQIQIIILKISCFPQKNIAGIFQEDRNKEDTLYSVYYNSTIIRALENKLVSLEAMLIRNSARPPTHHTMGFAL